MTGASPNRQMTDNGVPALAAIFAAAREDIPVAATGRMIIGVLEKGRTADSALVSYDNGREYRLHSFGRPGEAWRRGALLAQEQPSPTQSGVAASLAG